MILSRPTTPGTPASPTENPLFRRGRPQNLRIKSFTQEIPPTPEIDIEPKYDGSKTQMNSLTSWLKKIKCEKWVLTVSLLLNLIFFATILVALFGHMACPSVFGGRNNTGCQHNAKYGVPGVDCVVTNSGCCIAQVTNPEVKKLLGKHMGSVEFFPVLDSQSPDKNHNTGDSKDGSKDKIYTMARLILDVDKTKAENKLVWTTKTSTGLAFIQGQITFANDSLLVTDGGLYQISSHLGFDTFQNRFNNPKKQSHILTHSINKRSNGAQWETVMVERLLIEDMTYKTSSLTLTVKLRAGENILIYTDIVSVLYDLPIANTFEVLRIL